MQVVTGTGCDQWSAVCEAEWLKSETKGRKVPKMKGEQDAQAQVQEEVAAFLAAKAAASWLPPSASDQTGRVVRHVHQLVPLEIRKCLIINLPSDPRKVGA